MKPLVFFPPRLLTRLSTASVLLLTLAWPWSISTAQSLPAKQRPQQAVPANVEPAPFLYADHPGAMTFAIDLAMRRDLNPEWVKQQLGQAERLPQAIRLMRPAPRGTPKNWAAYRARFIEPVRIQAGRDFWVENRAWLERAQSEFGVPSSLVVGVIGVETLYGQHTGNFRVIDALTTLAFDFPVEHPRAKDRSAFFRAELEQFLSLTERSGMDPQTLLGSYAGAMGWPQFMPSSWIKYAIDFDGDGRVDLFNSKADVIGSVANYFVAHGWQSGMPTHYPVNLASDPAQLDNLLAPDILPTFSVDRFMANGARLEGPALKHAGKLALVELENGAAPRSYVAGTENFYTVTRYNWSSYYAMAVIELGQTIATQLPPR